LLGVLICGLAAPAALSAQSEKAAALKKALAENQQRLRQYKWVETTTISLKGEEKSRVQKLCFYGPDGKVQKQQLSTPPAQQAPGGLKGKVVAQKKEEMTEYMQQAVALVHQYVPPDSQRIQAATSAGRMSLNPVGPGAIRLIFSDYLKAGDSLGVTLDTAGNSIQTVNVKSYLASPQDSVGLDVTFAKSGEGLSYPANVSLSAPAKQMQVRILNSNYQKAQPSAPAAGASATGASSQALDSVLAPIALYPDALIAQILVASTNFESLQKFSGWMAGNSTLKGSQLQDAAQQAGFDPCLVALAPFPQVIQMMVQKPDWTRQLGKAFTADKNAVFESVQRLRVQAQAAGNLKSTPQQEVQTQTTSSGQQVIVVQPANPQVVYVPQYNPQTVYVTSPPPPSSGPSAGAAAAVGFTMGVVLASSSSHYYHGPYAWHGAALYEEMWEDRYDYLEDRQENRMEFAEDRREDYQQNASQRQSAAQSNQAERQSAVNANQTQRQTSVDSRQAQAQANMGSRQTQAQATMSSAQGNYQSAAAGRQAAASTATYGNGQAASARKGSSGGFSGYQGGAATRAQSARGSGSLASSRGSRR
jgi:hypothetical protein